MKIVLCIRGTRSSAVAEHLARDKRAINEGPEVSLPGEKLVRNKILQLISKPEMDKMGFGESKKIKKLLFEF